MSSFIPSHRMPRFFNSRRVVCEFARPIWMSLVLYRPVCWNDLVSGPYLSEEQMGGPEIICRFISESLVKLRATYMPDAARADFRTAPEPIPEEGSPPGSDIV